MTPQIQQHLNHSDMSLINSNMQSGLSPLISSIQICTCTSQHLHDRGLIAEGRVVNGAISILILQLDVRVVIQQNSDHFQVAVLAGGLQRRVAGKDAVDVGPDGRAGRVALFQHFLAFRCISVGGRFHELLVHVAGDVRLEELLEEGAETLAARGAVHCAVFAGYFGYG